MTNTFFHLHFKLPDRSGNDISTAQVGDALSLRFEFVDKNTPYQMFIRELVAVDGVDSAEIMLIGKLLLLL